MSPRQTTSNRQSGMADYAFAWFNELSQSMQFELWQAYRKRVGIRNALGFNHFCLSTEQVTDTWKRNGSPTI